MFDQADKMTEDTYYYYPAQEDMQRSDVHEMDSSPRVIKEDRKTNVF